MAYTDPRKDRPPIVFLASANGDEAHLDLLKKEIDEIEGFLRVSDAEGIIRVKRYDYATTANIIDNLLVLQNQLLLFHFAGHTGEGLLYLQNEKIKGKGIASFFQSQKELKLVFLNGCSNRELVEFFFHAGVPAVIATSVPVQDDSAKRFAEFFYLMLSRGKRLGEAFTHATETLADLPETKVIYRGMEFYPENGESPWGLYINKGADFILNWHLPLNLTAVSETFAPEESRKLSNRFCRYLEKRLDIIDKEANWQEGNFTPLDAEIEIHHRTRNKKEKAADVLKAVKKNRSANLFLLIGAPGSGKSTALRKLARDLLKNTQNTGVIPLYINLKRWVLTHELQNDEPPNLDRLDEFILTEATLKEGEEFRHFLRTRYHSLLEEGKFFLILDSFDEIPFLMNKEADSLLVDRLSERFYSKFSVNRSKIIIGSRPFRKPTEQFREEVKLTINPLSFDKMRQTFRNLAVEGFGGELEQKILSAHQWLIPVARNPFKNFLIVHFYEKTHDLPDYQIDLFRSYIQIQLEEKKEYLVELNITPDQVFDYSTEIAYFTYEKTSFGLEIPVSFLKGCLPQIPVKNAIAALNEIKIARITSDDRFTFVHRRFHEFFVSLKLLNEKKLAEAQFGSVPKDTRLRDTLVLFCEVTDPQTAKEFARKCWETIRPIQEKNFNQADYWAGIHALRFLIEAFANRKAQIDFLNEDLYKWVDSVISEKGNSNILGAKFALEAISLFYPIQGSRLIARALSFGVPWLSETAVDTSRQFSALPGAVQKRVFRYFQERYLSTSWFLPFFKLIKISRLGKLIRFSEAFNKIYYYLKLESAALTAKLLFPPLATLLIYTIQQDGKTDREKWIQLLSDQHILGGMKTTLLALNEMEAIWVIGIFLSVRLLVVWLFDIIKTWYDRIFFKDDFISLHAMTTGSLWKEGWAGFQRELDDISTRWSKGFRKRTRWLVNLFLIVLVIDIVILILVGIWWLFKLLLKFLAGLFQYNWFLIPFTLILAGVVIYWVRKKGVKHGLQPGQTKTGAQLTFEPGRPEYVAQKWEPEPRMITPPVKRRKPVQQINFKKSWKNLLETFRTDKEFQNNVIGWSVFGSFLLLKFPVPLIQIPLGLVLLIVIAVLVLYKRVYPDYQLIRTIQKSKRGNGKWQRKGIQKRFFKFNTNFFRRKFVHYLDRENIQAEGDWDEGLPPYLDNDIKSSEHIARLEAKWRGF